MSEQPSVRYPKTIQALERLLPWFTRMVYLGVFAIVAGLLLALGLHDGLRVVLLVATLVAGGFCIVVGLYERRVWRDKIERLRSEGYAGRHGYRLAPRVKARAARRYLAVRNSTNPY